MHRSIEANLSGRVAVVTGANTGIGKEIARDLARLRATVVLACRSDARGRAAVEEIARDTGNHQTMHMVVDTSSQSSIRDFAGALASKHDAVHILVNNAGIWQDARESSADGIELTWATNVLGYFSMTKELLPLLTSGARRLVTAAASTRVTARIVNVASEMARDLDLDDVEMCRRGYKGVTAYAQSKQANRMWTWGLAHRLRGLPVTANAMHPGWIATDIARRPHHGLKGAVACCAFRMFGKTPAEGADTASWLAASPEVEGLSGAMWFDRGARSCRFATDPGAIEKLWKLCESMTSACAGHSTSSTTLPNPSLLAT